MADKVMIVVETNSGQVKFQDYVDFEINENGTLVIFDQQLYLSAAYAPGHWTSVKIIPRTE